MENLFEQPKPSGKKKPSVKPSGKKSIPSTTSTKKEKIPSSTIKKEVKIWVQGGTMEALENIYKIVKTAKSSGNDWESKHKE